MIIGIGTDLANIERIEKTITRFGDRFRKRVFTEIELERAKRSPHPTETLAKRWAAKEACSKALGTGLAMGISWIDMSVSNLETGQPIMHLTGWAAKRLAELTPEGYVSKVHVSMTDDYPWAHADVIIAANKIGE